MALAAPIPANDKQRLQSLHSYKILDTQREAAFDDLTRIAAQICGTPMAIVSLIDENRQWFKSEIGLGSSETPRDVSFCGHAIMQDDVFIVHDTQRDWRFVDNVLVTGAPHLRFYAGAPLQTQDGHALGTLCVLDRVPRELTDDQKAALQALARQAIAQMEMRRALNEAERVISYRSRLMAVMGHDLQQPVNQLSMALTLLEGTLNGQEEDTVGYARSAIERLGSELSMLAQASRLDQDSVQVKSFPIQKLLDSLFTNWNLRAIRKGLELIVEPSSAIVESDERMLATVAGNLVGNAIKYTEAGSVRIACGKSDGGVTLSVTDTGIGIPEGQMDKIFTSFHQVNAETSEGLGLGLAIVARTAELIGCTIAVTSEVGKGSCFTITIPDRG